MNASEAQAIVTVSLLAAFVDSEKHEREREQIKRIADGLSQADGMNLPTLYQDVLLKRVTLPGVLPALASNESRQLAYEMAVCVCDAEGVQSKAEQAFLADLARALQLDAAATRQFTQQADEIAQTALVVSPPPSGVGSPAPAAPAVAVNDDELDKAIVNAAILNGALELLPETLSTMAIIPLQMKLVYRIGRAHGSELDSGHVKDFLATAGVGLTSQYLEQAGRKLLGGLLGRVGGSVLRGVGNQAVSSGMSFAATYALGHVAKRYYAGGRTLSTQMLKDAYASLVQEAQALQARHRPAMQERARSLNAVKVLELVRGA
jgi:uncharacterized protein (DUF697 family)/tellurite resistance protein